MEYYVVRELKNGEMSKGIRSGYSWENSTPLFRKAKATPPKLYSLGSAKTVVAGKRRWMKDTDFEIIPVTLTFGEPIKY
jgi:hypothetical protein